jgi:outer membrane protein assembly complex protein YaeT
MKGRWLKLAFLILLAGISILLLGVSLLHTPPARRMIFDRARSYLLRNSGIDLQASRFQINLFKKEIALDEVTIRSAASRDLAPILQASQVRFQLDSFTGIRGIRDLRIASPRIHIFAGADGRTNLPSPPSKSKTSTEFLILRGDVQNGSFQLEDFARKINLTVPNWNLVVNGDRGTREHSLQFSTSRKSSLLFQDRILPIEQMTLAGKLRGSALQLDMVRLRSPGSRVEMTGSIRNFSDPVVNLSFRPNMDLREISQALGSKTQIKGRLSGTVEVGGTVDRLQMATRIQGADISAGSYRGTSLSLNGIAQWDHGRLHLRMIEVNSPDGILRCSGTIHTDSGPKANILKGEISNFNLFPLWRSIHPPFDLASRGAGRFTLSWTGMFSASKVAGDAHLTLEAARTAIAPDVLPASGRLSAKFRPGLVLVDLRPLSTLGATFSGQFALHSFQEIEGDFVGSAPDIGDLTKNISRFLGGGDAPTGRIDLQGHLNFQAHASGKLNRPSVSISAEIRDLKAGLFKHLRLSTEASILGSKIAFHSTINMPDNAIARAQGSIDFSGSNTILEIEARTERLPVSALKEMLDSSLPISGEMSSNLHISGPVDALAGKGTVRGENLYLSGEQLGHLDLGLHLARKEIRSTRFILLKDAAHPETNRIDARFSYALNSDQFQFHIDGKDLRWNQLSLPDGIPLQGSWNLTASGSGTIARPSMDARLESTDLRVKQALIGPISISASLRQDQLEIEASAPRLNATSTIHIANESPYPFKGELLIANADLSRLAIAAANGEPLRGNLEARLTGSGDLKRVAHSSISAELRAMRLHAGAVELRTEGITRAEYKDNSLKVQSATVVSGNSRLEIAGRVPIRQPAPAGDLRVKGQLDLAQTYGFAALSKRFGASGIANVDLTLAGTPQEPNGTGTVVLGNGTISIPGIATPLTGVNLQAKVQQGSLILQRASASWDQGKIDITGTVPFGLLPPDLPFQIPRDSGPARFSLDITNLRPELSGKLPEGMSGLISLHADAQVSSADLRALKTSIDFRDLSFRVNEILLEQTRPSRIRISDGVASISHLAFSGADTSIDISGSTGLFPGDPVDLRLTGDLNAALLTFMSDNLKASGRMKVEIAATGNNDSPGLSGLATMRGGKVSLRNPRVVADSINAKLALDPKQISIQELMGTLNGGPMSMTGTLGYRGGILNDLNLKATVQDFFFNFPEGLKSSSSGTLTIESSEDSILVSGTMSVQESSYRETFGISSQLMGYLKSQQNVVMRARPDPILDRVRLNIALRTETPMLLRNNVARVSGDANLTIVGPFKEPSIVGRIELEDGGEIVLNQRTYYITRGSITNTNQTRIEPDMDIEAQTKAGNYEITLRLTGTPDRLVTAFTSEPTLSEPDIISLLLTGQTPSEAQGRGMQTARTQALAMLAGQAGEELAGEARRALRLSTLRIDPGLVASEADPGARLTLGQDITNNLSLIYSMNLTNGGDQIWAAQYKIIRRLTTQATKQQDNSYRFEFQHNLFFGGTAEPRSSTTSGQKFQIGTIKLQGGAPFSYETLLKHLKFKSGQKYDFQKVQKGLDGLNEFYAGQGRPEANVRMHRETEGTTVNLNLNIESGPEVSFSFEGIQADDKVRKAVEEAWKKGAFDIERLEDSVRAIRSTLLEEGFLQAEIARKTEMAGDRKRVLFQINPGTRYGKVPVLFTGASAVSAAQLNNVLSQAGLQWDIYTDPQKVADYFKQFYADRGYLQARVDSPAARLDPQKGTGQVIVRIQEGPRFEVGDLEFKGNRAFGYDDLWSVIPTSSGSNYDRATMLDSVKEIENFYRSRGYNEASATYAVSIDPSAPKANVTLSVVERRQSIIREITVEGSQRTSVDLVKRQLSMNVGDALDSSRIDETRKRLYSSGIYSSVDFILEEMPGAAADAGTKGVHVRIRVHEIQPYRLQYGLFYDTERGVGGILEAENRNLLGRALDLGVKFRYDSDLKEARLYFSQPHITKTYLKTDATAFVQEEDRPAYTADRLGFSLFQSKDLVRRFRLDYGYRYDRVRWTGTPPDPTQFQESVPVARLVAALNRDSRDSVLDPTHGEFASHSLEFGPRFVGSEIPYIRYYGQYFRYVSLDKFIWGKPKTKDKRALPPRILYAGALRLGLTTAFEGEEVISPERFFAGGGTTMRGFEQDMLGPVQTLPDGTVQPIGGEGLLLFNNEIRFPVFGILQGVGFLDIGNVYRTISDFNFNVRKTAGAGLRLKIKYIPLRFDYGLKLDRRPGESQGAFFFSIGQAF